jgi:hypothetical protein
VGLREGVRLRVRPAASHREAASRAYPEPPLERIPSGRAPRSTHTHDASADPTSGPKVVQCTPAGATHGAPVNSLGPVLSESFEARLCERSGYPRSQWRVPNEIPWVMTVKCWRLVR